MLCNSSTVDKNHDNDLMRASEEKTTSEVLEWRTHLLREDKLKGAIPVAVTVVCCIGAWFVFESWWWVVFTGLVLLLSMLKFYFPIGYKVNENGVTVTFLGIDKLRPWSDFKNIYKTKKGFFLAPFEKPSRLDAFRGLVINCPANSEEIGAFLERKIKH